MRRKRSSKPTPSAEIPDEDDLDGSESPDEIYPIEFLMWL
jgi:hypothetical protein